MFKKLLVILALLVSFATANAQYLPSNGTAINKPLGDSGFPITLRSGYFDPIKFTIRPFVSTSEVLAYFNTPIKRKWAHSIIINTGGTISQVTGEITGGVNAEWWFRDGVLDNNLVPKSGSMATIDASSNFIINSQQLNSSGSFTNTGGFVFSSNGLTVSGGTNGFDKKLSLTNNTMLEDYQIEFGSFISMTDGVGLAVGIDGAPPEYAIIKVDLSNSSSRGKISFTTDKSNNINTSAALNYTTGVDSLKITLRRSKYSAIAIFTNITTGKQVSTELNYTATAALYGAGNNINRIGKPAVWALGGTQVLTGQSFVYKSYTKKNPKLIIVENSIGYGYAAGTIFNRWTSLNGEAKFDYGVMATSSANTTDIVSNLPELGLLKPEYAAFIIGVNDAIQGWPIDITQSNITTINNYCIANGIKPIWCTATPLANGEQNAKVIANNTFIQGLSDKGAIKVIDFNGAVFNGQVSGTLFTGDGVHPGPFGHSSMARYFIEQTNDLFTYDDRRSRYTLSGANASTDYIPMNAYYETYSANGTIQHLSETFNYKLTPLQNYLRDNTLFSAVRKATNVGRSNSNTSITNSFINISGVPYVSSDETLTENGNFVNHSLYGRLVLNDNFSSINKPAITFQEYQSSDSTVRSTFYGHNFSVNEVNGAAQRNNNSFGSFVMASSVSTLNSKQSYSLYFVRPDGGLSNSLQVNMDAFGTLKHIFNGIIVFANNAAPTTSSTPGIEGQVVSDANYFYWYNGGRWNRAPRDPTF